MSKHNPLSEEELNDFQLRPYINRLIQQYKDDHSITDNSDIRILDWGCGRGISVIKLLDEGYDAYGVEIDQNTMTKGFKLLTNRGYDPKERILHVNNSSKFEDQFFDIVFSEQVLEHVEDLDAVVCEFGRITKNSGVGVHAFPGAKNIIEVHLFMPFVHWLPKNFLRFIVLYFFVMQGKYPAWPETYNKDKLAITKVFYQYLNKKTYYRDINKILKVFSKYGMQSKYKARYGKKRWFVPSLLYRNAFPKGVIILNTQKE